ncbi:MAG: hypothetical protein E6590_16720 [Clostridiales bacterium]|nr:hypothetical protein [Clostridiales bacterium]
MEDKDKRCWDCIHCTDGYCGLTGECPVWIEDSEECDCFEKRD